MTEFRRFDHLGARKIRVTVQDVYARAYTESVASDDPFESLEAAMRRFDAYTSRAGFDLVVLYSEGEAIGQAWGWPLTANSRWWNGLHLDEEEPDFTTEDGTRTFALSEIMVVREHTGRGHARALHDELLAGRQEQRATLLVDPTNENAYARYRKWGWFRVGVLRPDWDGAPVFDVLIRKLAE
ncbi:GNAT family N-acetyltransferase [Nocardia cyriacigeorgica]|uniref:Putative acetyltransferase n=1 Tax=Nocardia cyriacigeorgica (strain GUH-2) TaxID=1127134 RepID=H6R9B7_NOCCG|nr:GNAT family N-acetyltransferase [Nocardia cyriacigeorgica]CCF64898.1 putative acetyltransferase [Nocardia cyriacigeorgica GUH-2]